MFRERTEKVAQVNTFAYLIGQVFNLNVDKVFGPILQGFAAEVFQESYNPELLRDKIASIRDAQIKLKKKRQEQDQYVKRLESLGDLYEKDDNNKKSR